MLLYQGAPVLVFQITTAFFSELPLAETDKVTQWLSSSSTRPLHSVQDHSLLSVITISHVAIMASNDKGLEEIPEGLLLCHPYIEAAS